MSYPYPPYMQAAPPPGYGAPGSTGYFTTQNLGGFYAPISSNPPFATAGQPQPQMLGTPGSGGQLFNNWPGSREEQEKQQQAEEAKKQEQKQKQRGGERGSSRGGDRSNSRNDNSNRDHRDGSHKSKKAHKKGRSTPWEEVVERLGDVSIKDEGEDDDDSTLYDHCENSSDGSDSPRGSNSSSPGSSNNGPVGTSIDDQELTIQAGGSARVIMHLLRVDEPPYNTTFIASARRMLAMARGWPHVCHQGTNDYEVTVMDESAVLGMYWLLQVLHMSVEEQQFYQGNDPSSSSSSTSSNEHRLRRGMAPATTPRSLPPTIPSELPARVLAYATMYASQIGVLEQNNNKQQMLGNGPAGPQSSPAGPPADRFRTRAEAWMRAVTTNPRCRRTLDSALVAPAEWPFVLYTARVLGDRQLFAIVLRTLLERWWVNERGIFCDVNGPARIDKLPDAMREVVMKDLSEYFMPPFF